MLVNTGRAAGVFLCEQLSGIIACKGMKYVKQREEKQCMSTGKEVDSLSQHLEICPTT